VWSAGFASHPLLDVVHSCLSVDPASRPTTSQLITALTRIKTGGPVTGLLPAVSAVPPPTPVIAAPATAMFDVLTIVEAMETQGIAEHVIAGVSDTIGHQGMSRLDVLLNAGVSALKTVAVRKALLAQPTHAPSQVWHRG
jgi:hypothetical protein